MARKVAKNQQRTVILSNGRDQIILSDKIIRGWLTLLDAYGNIMNESQYIEFNVPCTKGGKLKVKPGLIVYFKDNGFVKKTNREGIIVEAEVEEDEFYNDGLFYITIPGVEGPYYCFETNEHIQRMKLCNEDIIATPFACVG